MPPWCLLALCFPFNLLSSQPAIQSFFHPPTHPPQPHSFTQETYTVVYVCVHICVRISFVKKYIGLKQRPLGSQHWHCLKQSALPNQPGCISPLFLCTVSIYSFFPSLFLPLSIRHCSSRSARETPFVTVIPRWCWLSWRVVLVILGRVRQTFKRLSQAFVVEAPPFPAILTLGGLIQ